MPAKVNKELCLGCGACTATCPVEAIQLGDDGLAEVDETLCIECGGCVAGCPVEAIEL